MCVGYVRSPQLLTNVSSGGIHALAAFLQLELFRVNIINTLRAGHANISLLGTSVRDKKCIIIEHPTLRNFYTALRTD